MWDHHGAGLEAQLVVVQLLEVGEEFGRRQKVFREESWIPVVKKFYEGGERRVSVHHEVWAESILGHSCDLAN